MDPKDPKVLDQVKDGHIVPPDVTFNGNFTAIPKDVLSADDAAADPDLVTSQVDYGDMNEEDARESGYIPKDRKH